MEPLNPKHKAFLREHFRKKNLSRSEVEVVILVLQGLINREVANRLCVAEKTIKFHLGNAYKKLNISRRSQLIWTLPLAEFVGVANKNTSNQNVRSEEIKPQEPNNDLIPFGRSTVSDMINEEKERSPESESDMINEEKERSPEPDPDL